MRFDESTKRTFRSVDEMSLIQFGSVSDRDDKCGIRAGKLKLSGYVLRFTCDNAYPLMFFFVLSSLSSARKLQNSLSLPLKRQ